jgi:choloylglycine hydrolase
LRQNYPHINAVPKTDKTRIAVASALSVIRNCSVPYGISSATEPNISSTQWRTVADHKNLVCYFENVLSPNVVWVEFSKLNFSENAPVKMLSLENNENFFGECSMNFKTTKPFQFVGL